MPFSIFKSSDSVADTLAIVDVALGSIARRLPAHVSRDDLASAGKLALVEALLRYDGPPDQARGYCFARVRGAMLDELRRLDPLSRYTRTQVTFVRRATAALERELGRAPTPTEVSTTTGLSTNALAQLDRLATAAAACSVDETDADGENLHVLVDDDSACPASTAESVDAHASIHAALDRLAPNHAHVLRRYYLDDVTLDVIAAELGVSKERVRQLAIFDRIRSDVNAWLDSGKRNGLSDSSLPDRAGELVKLPGLEDQLKTLQSTIELLSTPERTKRQERLDAFNQDKAAIDGRIAVLAREAQLFNTKAQPARDGKAAAGQKIGQMEIDIQIDRARLGRDFAGIPDAEFTVRRDAIRTEFPQWQECFKQVLNRAAESELAAVAAKGERLRERRELMTVRDEHGLLRHPEYQNEFKAENDDNQPWADRLQALEKVELTKSRQLAEDRRRDWERRLEDNVLKELKQRTDDAERTIKSLDKHLGQPVGKYRYRISYRRDQSGFGAAWRLLDTGFAETDPLMAAIGEDEVKQAKTEMMKAINDSADGNERARRLLDYRNYHHYDIEMVPADRQDAPPISLGKSGRNLSGGENQAPFFISMLAAFRRVYDKGNRQATRSQQLGLVVMDEAFSKLSGDGIEDCLALAHSFQLQLVMAFPPERLGVMVPYAQTVVVCRKHTESDPKDGYVTRIDNIPMIMTMPEAMDALA